MENYYFKEILISDTIFAPPGASGFAATSGKELRTGISGVSQGPGSGLQLLAENKQQRPASLPGTFFYWKSQMKQFQKAAKCYWSRYENNRKALVNLTTHGLKPHWQLICLKIK